MPNADLAADRDARARLRLGRSQLTLFHAVCDVLAGLGAPYAVGGALAMHRYTGLGHPTKDLDLFLLGEWVERALAALAAADLATSRPDPVWLAKVTRGRFFVDLISGMSNGALWVTADWLADARVLPLFGRSLSLLAPEEMILSKLFVTRRERFDGADIAHLIYRAPRLDWRRILARAGKYGGEILLWHLLLFRYVYPAAEEKVPRWVWRRLAREAFLPLGRGPRPLIFRGTLVDEAQFRADVAAWGLPDLQAELRRRRLELLGKEAEAA